MVLIVKEFSQISKEYREANIALIVSSCMLADLFSGTKSLFELSAVNLHHKFDLH
jgi:hypothetical protein